MRFRNFLLGGGLLLTAPLALSHHSQAMFDTSRSQTISGTVTEFNWVNPHSSIKIEVVGANGKPEIWAIEMNTPQNLVRAGWKRTTLKAGDKVTAVVRPMRNGMPGGLYVSVTLPDGKVMGSGETPGE